VAGDHEASYRYATRYLDRKLTQDEAFDDDLVIELWCASAGHSGSTPSYYHPSLPRAATGLAHDLAVPADSPVFLDWPWPVTSVERTDLVQQ
jgi:hypothetical protein